MPVSASGHAHYLTRVGQALSLSQGELAERLSVSRRTISRWMNKGINLAYFDAPRLVGLALPVDPALAAEIAAAAGSSLAQMGFATPDPRPPPPAPPALLVTPPAHLVDVVVCAAAEALDVSPRAVRPALLAAFRRAREAGLSLHDVEAALTPPPKPAPETP